MGVLYAPLLPLVLVCTIAGLVLMVLKNEAGAEDPMVELVITPDELTLVRADEFRMRVSPRSARWLLMEETELHMAADKQVQVLALSKAARMQADWFHNYVRARCQEIGSRPRSQQDPPRFDSPNAQIAYEEETDQLAVQVRPVPRRLAVDSAGDADEATEQVAAQVRPARRPDVTKPTDLKKVDLGNASGRRLNDKSSS
jgi:hypothetical protein